MYEVKTVDLSAAFDTQTIAVPQRRIAEIICFDVPSGASFGLRVGNSVDFMTISKGFTMEPRGDDESNGGVVVRNLVAQPNTTVEIVLVYGGDALAAVLT